MDLLNVEPTEEQLQFFGELEDNSLNDHAEAYRWAIDEEESPEEVFCNMLGSALQALKLLHKKENPEDNEQQCKSAVLSLLMQELKRSEYRVSIASY